MQRAQVPVILYGVVVQYMELDIETPPKTVNIKEAAPPPHRPSALAEASVYVAPAEKGQELVFIGRENGKDTVAKAQKVAPRRAVAK